MMFLQRATIIFLVLVCGAPPLMAKRKDDIVIMKNGDRFTGEIKGPTRGGTLIQSQLYDLNSPPELGRGRSARKQRSFYSESD